MPLGRVIFSADRNPTGRVHGRCWIHWSRHARKTRPSLGADGKPHSALHGAGAKVNGTQNVAQVQELSAGAPVVPFSPPAKEIHAGPARRSCPLKTYPTRKHWRRTGRTVNHREEGKLPPRLPWMARSGLPCLSWRSSVLLSLTKGLAGKQPAPTLACCCRSHFDARLHPSVGYPGPHQEPLPPTPTSDPTPACTDIGQEWVSPLDGQTLVCVPAGSCSRWVPTGPNCYDACATVELDAFWIDKT